MKIMYADTLLKTAVCLDADFERRGDDAKFTLTQAAKLLMDCSAEVEVIPVDYIRKEIRDIAEDEDSDDEMITYAESLNDLLTTWNNERRRHGER